MEPRTFRPLMVMAAAAALGVGAMASPLVRVMDFDEPSRPLRAPAPAGGRTYAQKGKREAERRRRQLARINNKPER